MFNGLRRLRLWWRSNPNPNPTTASTAAENDQLSRLPDELVVEILTKLDVQTLCRCSVASPRFLPFVAQIPSLSTALPPSLLLGKPKSPENTTALTFPRFWKYFYFLIALISCAAVVYLAAVYVVYPLLCLPFRLFYRHHPYSWLALLPAVPGIGRFFSRHRILSRFLSVLCHPMCVRALVLVFRLVRSVVLHPLIRVPLGVFLDVIIRIITFPMCFIWTMYVPQVSASGQQFFQRLTRLNSLDVTLPPLWFDHPRLWIRGDIVDDPREYAGRKRYGIFVTGDIVDESKQYATGNDIEMFGESFKVRIMAFIRYYQVFILLASFSDGMEHSKVVRYTASKSFGLNTRVRFYFQEVSSQTEFKQSSMDCLEFYNEIATIVGYRRTKFRHVFPCTLSLNEGHVQLQDAILMFTYIPGADDNTSFVVDDDFISAYLCDEEEGCEGDIEGKELKEAVRVILSTPAIVTL